MKQKTMQNQCKWLVVKGNSKYNTTNKFASKETNIAQKHLVDAKDLNGVEPHKFNKQRKPENQKYQNTYNYMIPIHSIITCAVVWAVLVLRRMSAARLASKRRRRISAGSRSSPNTNTRTTTTVRVEALLRACAPARPFRPLTIDWSRYWNWDKQENEIGWVTPCKKGYLTLMSRHVQRAGSD